jgi:hypothetical protein
MLVSQYARRIMSAQMTDLRTAQAVTGNPDIRKFVLSAFHKIDPSVDGPIPVDQSVTAMLQVIQDLTEANSGKFVTHHGNDSQWF